MYWHASTEIILNPPSLQLEPTIRQLFKASPYFIAAIAVHLSVATTPFLGIWYFLPGGGSPAFFAQCGNLFRSRRGYPATPPSQVTYFASLMPLKEEDLFRSNTAVRKTSGKLPIIPHRSFTFKISTARITTARHLIAPLTRSPPPSVTIVATARLGRHRSITWSPPPRSPHGHSPPRPRSAEF
jgi:hypothetical protein